jgi:TP901 family phage tail tape measure protein
VASESYLPPAMIRLLADVAALKASLTRATAAVEEAAVSQTAIWQAEYDRQAAAAERNALSAQVAQARALEAGTAEFTAAQAKQTAAAEAAAAKEKAAQEGALGKINDKFSEFGKLSAEALVGVGIESIHLAATFDAQMEKLQSQLGMTTPQVNALKSQVLALAGKVGQSPDSLAEALTHVEAATRSLGTNAPPAMDVLTAAGKAAAVSGANLVDVTNMLDAAMVSGLPGMQNLSAATGQLVAAVGQGDMSMQDMADAFGKGNSAIWKNYGLSVKDVTASLALFGDMNLRGAAAGTAMTNTMKYMLKPATGAKKLFPELGLSVKQLENDITSGGLPKAIGDIKAKLDKFYGSGARADLEKQVALTSMFGSKGGNSLSAMIGAYGVYTEKVKAAGAATGDINKAFAETEKNSFAQRLHELKASAEALGIRLGNWLIPKLEALAKFFSSHQKITEGLIAAFAGLMALSIVVWINNLMNSAMKMGKGLVEAAKGMKLFGAASEVAGAESEAAFAVNPVMLIIAAVALLVIGIYELIKHWKGVKKVFEEVGKGLSEAWKATVGFVVRIWDDCWKAVKGALVATWNFLKPIFSTIATVINYLLIPLRLLVFVWIQEFKLIEFAVMWLWHNVLEPLGKFVATLFRDVIGFELHILAATWHTVWGAISATASWAWDNVLSPVFHTLAGAFDSVIGVALRLLKTNWDILWNGLKDTVTTIWHVLKPIFDTIGGAVGGMVKAVGGVLGKVNKVLPFADGGSPPTGRAVLVGEQGPELAVFGAPAYIHPASATRSILAGGKASGGFVGMSSAGGYGGGITVNVTVQASDVQIDGQKVFTAVQQAALRHNRRNPTSGLSVITRT